VLKINILFLLVCSDLIYELFMSTSGQTLFAVKGFEPELGLRIRFHCGSGRCSAAKKFRCTCSCGHRNDGSKYKDGLARLDQVLKETK